MIPGLIIAAIPFAFAAVRAISTGRDFRYVWLALASTLAAAVIFGVRSQGRTPSYRRTIVAVLAALAAAAATGAALGAASAPSVLIVALGFAVCSGSGLGIVFGSRARHAGRRPGAA